NYADLFKAATQFNTGATFPQSNFFSVQVNVVFNNVPVGFDISGCVATLTDVTGAAPLLYGTPTLSAANVTATSRALTVLFSSPVDQANIDVLWVVCTKVGVGTATLPLPSTPITAQVLLGPNGDALGQNGLVLTGLTT